MNRQQRRAATRRARKMPVDPVTAIHEAGHAAFAILFSPSAGWPEPEGALNYIDLYAEPTISPMGFPVDGFTSLRFCPSEMDVYLQPVLKKAAENGSTSWPEIKPAFAEMRAAGIDLHAWHRMRLLMAVAGPVAEAKATGKPSEVVFFEEACTADFDTVKRISFLCGLSQDEAIEKLDRALSHAEQLVEKPAVWAAIIRLTAHLKHGRMLASEAVKIIYSSQQCAA